MSRAPWTPEPARLRHHPQLAALATLDHQLHLIIGVLAAVHEGQDGTLPELHQARASPTSRAPSKARSVPTGASSMRSRRR